MLLALIVFVVVVGRRSSAATTRVTSCRACSPAAGSTSRLRDVSADPAVADPTSTATTRSSDAGSRGPLPGHRSPGRRHRRSARGWRG